MKTLSILFFALLFAVSSFGRVRTGEPRYKITGVRIVDSVTYVRYSFDFGKHIA